MSNLHHTLRATGPANQRFAADLSNNFVSVVQEYPPEPFHILGHAEGDLLLPTAIALTGCPSNPYPDSSDALILEIGSRDPLLRIPLSVLALESADGQCIFCPTTDQHILTFRHDMFLPAIPILRLQHHPPRFRLESGRLFSLQARITRLDTAERTTLLTRAEHPLPLQQVATYIHPDPVRRLTATAPFTGITKGYLIEAPDISALRHVRLQFTLPATGTTVTRLDYGPARIATAGIRLSPRHIWFALAAPNETAKAVFDTNPRSFRGGFNQDAVTDLQIHLEFAEEQDFIRIHCLSLNELLTHGGMATPHYAHNPLFRPVRNFSLEAPAIVAPLPEGRDQCPITYDSFASGDAYGRCATCNQCFHLLPLQEALALSRTCPICRVGWTDWTVYQVPVAPPPLG
jgi:hypothetical protein